MSKINLPYVQAYRDVAERCAITCVDPANRWWRFRVFPDRRHS